MNENQWKTIDVSVFGPKEPVSEFSFPDLPAAITQMMPELAPTFYDLNLDTWLLMEDDYNNGYDDYINQSMAEEYSYPANYTGWGLHIFNSEANSTKSMEMLKQQQINRYRHQLDMGK